MAPVPFYPPVAVRRPPFLLLLLLLLALLPSLPVQAAAGTLAFVTATASVNEGAGTATIALSRSGGSDGPLTARVDITPGTATAADYFSPGSLDSSFNTSFEHGQGTDGAIQALAVQPDGKVVIAGSFLEVNGASRRGIARLHADGSLDASFDAGIVSQGGVMALALQPDGKVLYGSTTGIINGVLRDSIIRLNADGSFDSSFDPSSGVVDQVFALAVQPDGKVLIGGRFSQINGTPRNNIARLNADGSLDTSFDPGTGVNGDVGKLALQSDGEVLIGGWFTQVNGTTRNRIARLHADGSLDTAFHSGSGANGPVLALALQPDGKVLIGGGFTTFNGTTRNGIARLNGNGSLDTSFDPASGANNSVVALAVQPDGKVLLSGQFTQVNGTTRNGIARLNADGSLDSSFEPGSGADSSGEELMVQPDGKVLFSGYSHQVNGTFLTRLNGDMFVRWPAGVAGEQTIVLPLVDDSLVEGDERLTLTLTPLSGARLGTPSSLSLAITDNDSVLSINLPLVVR